MKINFCGIEMKNPVTTASGTFGSGREYEDFLDLNTLGAVTVKGVSAVPWTGNPCPRIAETHGGMLNSIGLQNLGVNHFLANDLPYLKQFDTNIIVNVCGNTVAEYVEAIEMLNQGDVDLYELNISCPNVAQGGLAFGTNTKMVEEVVSAAKKAAKKPLIVKLSPNVTDIAEIAKSAEAAGADALSLINTLLGMKIDIFRRKPVLKNKMGGLSGPSIKPVAIRMVYQVHKAVRIPLIGMGGIMTWEDAVEFIMAGAHMVAVGTGNFHNPKIIEYILEGMKTYQKEQGIEDFSQIRGIID